MLGRAPLMAPVVAMLPCSGTCSGWPSHGRLPRLTPSDPVSVRGTRGILVVLRACVVCGMWCGMNACANGLLRVLRASPSAE